MTDKRIKMALIAGAFVLTLGLGSVALSGVDDTLEFVSGIVGMFTEAN